MSKAKLSHFDDKGAAVMVDVSAKGDTERVATAAGSVIMQPATLKLIQAGGTKKGDVLAVARLAGIMGAKRTPDLIPLCHPLGLNSVSVELVCDPKTPRRRHRGDRENHRQNRGRDGGADRRFRRRADHLRHVQGGGSRHAHREHPPHPQIRRQVRDVTRRHDPGRRSPRAAARPLKPLGTEQITVGDAFGRVLAEDVAARRTQPPSALSAMDGYAVRAADVAQIPARLKIVGAVPAGKSYDKTLGAGEAVRIFTGAPLPGRRRRHRHPGRHRPRRRHRHRQGIEPGRPPCPRGRPRFPRGRRAPQGRP